MKIYFNQIGALVNRDTSDEAIRQGNIGNKITAYFENKSNSNYVAKLTFTRPDGSHLDNVVMTPSQDDESAFDFELNDEWYLAIYGNASVTIFLMNGTGNIIASGQVEMPIEKSDYYENPETITVAQYNALLDVIANLLNISNGISVHNNIDNVDITPYSDGQIFFSKANTKFYIKEANNLKEYDIFNPGNKYVSAEENEYIIPPEDQ